MTMSIWGMDWVIVTRESQTDKIYTPVARKPAAQTQSRTLVNALRLPFMAKGLLRKTVKPQTVMRSARWSISENEPKPAVYR